MRIAGSSTGVLVGIYLASLATNGATIDVALAGRLGAVAFAAELIGAMPLGIASDALAPRSLITAGAILAAAATQLFGMTGRAGIFFLSRGVEGLGAAASTPALLAHLTDVTEGDPALRGRVMSYFELSLLGGLALGGLFAGQLWHWFGPGAFAAVAASYLVSAALMFIGAAGGRSHGTEAAMAGLRRAMREPALRRLAPIWLCVNTIVGIWLGPAFSFLLTAPSSSGQYLAGAFHDVPEQVGWVMLGYSIIFATGVTIWSQIMTSFRITTVLRIALVAMLAACAGLYAINHSTSAGTGVRWAIGAVTAITVMVESGFTPAALSLVASAVGSQVGRGAAMGIYSVLLSVGAIIGSLLAGWLGSILAVDGLIYSTLAMAVVALALLARFPSEKHHERAI